MGRGTTFATGTTAGAAALWIAYLKDEPAFADLVRDGARKAVRVYSRVVSSRRGRPRQLLK